MVVELREPPKCKWQLISQSLIYTIYPARTLQPPALSSPNSQNPIIPKLVNTDILDATDLTPVRRDVKWTGA